MSPLLLFDGSDEAAIARWRAVNDPVMGGRSDGRLRPSGAGAAVFEGRLALTNGGGFASVRSDTTRRDLSPFGAFLVRVRGDGRRYDLGLYTDETDDGTSYRARFAPPAGTWQTVRIPFADLAPVFRGRPAPAAPPFAPHRVRALGFLVADGVEGPFRLAVASVHAAP